MTPRWATTGVFAVNGAAVGIWVAQIPWVQERFDLSKSAIGLMILGMVDRGHPRLPIAGQAVVRHGSERIVCVGGDGLRARRQPAHARARPAARRAGLFVLGGASATMDVAMNSHGVTVEKALGRPIMSSLHAGWAFGGMGGAGFVALCHALGVDARSPRSPPLLLLPRCSSRRRRIGHGSAAEGDDTPGFTLPSRGVVLLAVLCFLVMITEGAMADWSGLYLRQDLGASAAVAALAYSFFTARHDRRPRSSATAINARIGAGRAAARRRAAHRDPARRDAARSAQPAPALIGLFLVGLGVANGVPLMFSAAGRQPDTPPGPGIAAVSSMGSLGFLAGPPVFGFFADATSLPWSLSLLILGAVVVLRPRPPRGRRARARARRPTRRPVPVP